MVAGVKIVQFYIIVIDDVYCYDFWQVFVIVPFRYIFGVFQSPILQGALFHVFQISPMIFRKRKSLRGVNRSMLLSYIM
jgi:hypothetical protein